MTLVDIFRKNNTHNLSLEQCPSFDRIIECISAVTSPKDADKPIFGMLFETENMVIPINRLAK